MGNYGCGSSIVWNVLPGLPLENVVISVYH